MSNLWVNGEKTSYRPGESLRALLQRLSLDPERPGIAVAVNDEVVPRSAWASRDLAPDDRVEILHAVQGG